MNELRTVIASMAALLLTASAAVVNAQDVKAGVAKVVITPDAGLWLAGYAARNKPAEGKLHDLYAKALALEDRNGNRLLLVTTDLLGLPRGLATNIAEEIEKSTKVPRQNLMLTSSHTHCGPVLRNSLFDMYDITDEQRQKLDEYAKALIPKVVAAARDALADLKPAKISMGEGTARFAINRRAPVPQGVNLALNPQGPVDHSVAILRVTDGKGEPRALVFGYACHNTTLDNYLWSGDYAGFAQENLEKQFPGCVAMFWSGCGGDANPHPRRTIELCAMHGKELAGAVADVAKGSMKELTGTFSAHYAEIPIRFAPLPPKEHWEKELASSSYAQRTRAARFLKILELGGWIPDLYPHYPVQVWKLGDQLTWVALGGEVVVDYALRIKRELGLGRPTWVTAYANDVMCYVPSVRVLREGGYEGDTSMIYYGMPGKWHEEIEDKIIAKVLELAR